MRKITVLLLALAMLMPAFSFTACGDAAAKTAITVGMWPAVSSGAEYEYYEKCKADFESDFPDYEIVPSSYAYSSGTITAKAMSGQLPVVFTSLCSETGFLAANGYVRGVTERVDALGWRDKMDDSLQSMLTSDGELYGVPCEKRGMGMFLNLSMLHGAGLIDKKDGRYILYDAEGEPLYPTAFDEVAACAAAVCARYDNARGIAFLSADTYGGKIFENIAWNFGAEGFQVREDGQTRANINSLRAVTAMRWIQNLCREGFAVTEPSYLGYADLYSCLGNSAAAIAFCYNDAVAKPMRYFRLDPADVAFVPLPRDAASFSSCDGSAFFFDSRATDEQVTGALLFLKYLGRSPETDSRAIKAVRERYDFELRENAYVLPAPAVWTDETCAGELKAVEDAYVNVNRDYYKDFLSSLSVNRRFTDYRFREQMYTALDGVLRKIIESPNAYNAYTLLTDANDAFQRQCLDGLS